MTTLIQHHTKYLEIDGYDEIHIMPISTHLKIHHHNGSQKQKPELKIPRDISIRAHKRSLKCKQTNHIYSSKIRRIITLHNTISKNIDFWEIIKYNENTGVVEYDSGFYGKHGYKLLEVQI